MKLINHFVLEMVKDEYHPNLIYLKSSSVGEL
jgi:hypothetical protein